jgi:hypothetical protein
LPFLSEVNHSSTFLLSFYLTKKKCLKHKLKNKIKRVQLNNILRLDNERLDGEEPSPGHQQQYNDTEDLVLKNERNKLNHKQVELKTKRTALVTLLKVMSYGLYLPTKWKSKGIVDAANEPM